MKRKLKWVITIGCFSLIALVVVIHMGTQPLPQPTEIKEIHADFAIDIDNPREVVGDADYVLVGLVESTRDVLPAKDKSGFPDVIRKNSELGNPYTEYNVKVIANIKGTLQENETIPIYKVGGISADGKYRELFENDSLPEVGKYYIFIAYGQVDGTLTTAGGFSSIALEDGFSPDKIDRSPLVAQYREAYEQEIVRPNKPKGHLSKYDVNYKNHSAADA